ncbi:MAG: hypothetical protein IJ083_18570 [Clostridia bacterium]|nr:hypothetical protein [Clostridia bacterium]
MKIQTRFVISTLGLVAYALEQVLLFQSQRSVMLKDLPILLVPIRLYFLLDALLVLLFSNQEALEGANIGLRRIPEHICAINRLLSVMMLLVTIILSFIPQIGDALYRLYTLVKRGIVSLVAFLSRFLPEMGQQGGGGGGAREMMMGAEETQEPSLLWTILEKVFMVLAFAVLLVLVFFLLRTLFRKLRMWIRKLLGRMQEFLRDASEDYEDEVFDTRSGDGESRERGGQRRRGRKRIRESELSPRELIRYRYARFLSQHPAADPGVTAREQIRSDQASLYEKARYSEHPVNAEEASEFSPELT